MTAPRICLDLDSTLARTCDVAFELLCGPDHDYTYSDIESWEWGLREFGNTAGYFGFGALQMLAGAAMFTRQATDQL